MLVHNSGKYHIINKFFNLCINCFYQLTLQVIHKIETFNTTTIRSSTPQYLMSKKIAARGFKMVMSGEGADEAWGGYLYFHYAPNDEGRLFYL